MKFYSDHIAYNLIDLYILGRQSNTGSLTMTTTGEASMIIGDEKDAICYIKAALYCCKRTIQCYQDIAQCLRNCRKNV
jgi:hypothetical protein